MFSMFVNLKKKKLLKNFHTKQQHIINLFLWVYKWIFITQIIIRIPQFSPKKAHKKKSQFPIIIYEPSLKSNIFTKLLHNNQFLTVSSIIQ